VRPAPAGLPASDFRTIAADLHLFAEREAMGRVGLETFIAKAEVVEMADASRSHVLRQCLVETDRAAGSAARLSSLFSVLAEHEDEVRAFVAQLLERRPRIVALPQGDNDDATGCIRPMVNGEVLAGSFSTEIVGSYRKPAEVIIRLRGRSVEFAHESAIDERARGPKPRG